MKFNYHMYGLKMGSLEVKTNTKSLFLRGGDQLDQWHYAVVPVQEEQDLKVSGVLSLPFCFLLTVM